MLSVSPPGGGEISSIASSGLATFEAAIGRAGPARFTLQAAARCFLDALVARAPLTTVLARVLVTRPWNGLPREERGFADRLATAHGVRDRLHPDTPVLAMLASRGTLPEWNDPRTSTRHRAVPLTDAGFVRAFPMVGRMLDDLGVSVPTPVPRDRPSQPMLGRPGEGGMGVFHVRDARSPEAAALIPDRHFVTEHGVRSVFGLGSPYVDGSVLVVLVFSRDLVERETVVRLAPLAAALKQRTYPALAADRVFDADAT